MSTQWRLREVLRAAGRDPAMLHFQLLTRSGGIMPGHSPGVRERFERIFAERGIPIRTDSPVKAVTQAEYDAWVAENKVAGSYVAPGPVRVAANQ